MKTTRRLSLWALALLALGLRLSAAERPCAPLGWVLSNDPPPTCVVTQYWSRPIDLDGDAVPEFWHERFYAKQDWNNGLWWSPEQYAVSWLYDDIEAFFFEPQVEILYMYMWRLGPEEQLVRLPEGMPIELEPTGWRPWGEGWQYLTKWEFSTWPPERLDAHGLGWLHRDWGRYNIDGCGFYDPPGNCSGQVSLGYVPHINDPAGYLFGFRLRRPDGWHLGWVRVVYFYTYELYAAREPLLTVAASAVHPDPDTAILAGQPPQPRLYARVEAAEAVLHWSAAWTGYTLQSSPSLTTPDWQPVAGVTNNTLRLPKSGGPAFFRLSQ